MSESYEMFSRVSTFDYISPAIVSESSGLKKQAAEARSRNYCEISPATMPAPPPGATATTACRNGEVSAGRETLPSRGGGLVVNNPGEGTGAVIASED